jgi:hypothetical protein
MDQTTRPTRARHPIPLALLLAACGAAAIPALAYLVFVTHLRSFRETVGESAISWMLDFLAIFLVALASLGLVAGIACVLGLRAPLDVANASAQHNSRNEP